MNKQINKISSFSEENLQKYLKTEPLSTLHGIKIFLDDIYYNTGDYSGFTDWQYDELKETLSIRDPGYVVPIGTKIRIGENRVELPYWLGSMDKFKPEDVEYIQSWVKTNKSTEYIIEDKLDGVSCLMIMTNGKIKLYTRGDGIVGADISPLAQYFGTIPKNTKTTISVRGELIMKKEIFDKKYSKDTANPRNMVAGRLNAKTTRKGLKDIDFVVYEMVGDGVMPTQSEQLKKIKKLGFTVVRHVIVDGINVDNLTETLISFKDTSPYEIDGIIVQPNKPYQRNTSANPEYGFAFKMRMSDNLSETTVINIDWNVSKWGQLKPRVQVEPVHLGGTTISWASGFNAKFIKNNKIGTGAVINITRSGDVIPYIVNVVKPAKEGQMPNIEYKWNKSGVDIYTEDHVEIRCVKLISSFFNNMGIKHVSEATVTKMYSHGFTSLLKIISATEEEFEEIDGFGKGLVKRTYKNIHSNLNDLSIPLVLGASGIFGFGMGKKKITKLFDGIPDIMVRYKKISSNQLLKEVLSVDGYSEKTAKKVVDNIQWADWFIEALKNYATFKTVQILSQEMKGNKYVMSGFRDKKLESDIIARGGKVTSSVSKNTSGVIVVSKTGKMTGKPLNAQRLGVPLYEKQEFIDEFIV
jgi:DNA ligase (NAD+)